MELLLEHGATVDPASNSGTPLLWAIGANKRECASFLLDKGANPDGQGDNGVSACLLAAATGPSTQRLHSTFLFAMNMKFLERLGLACMVRVRVL